VNKVTNDLGAPLDSIEEAARRYLADGIPRHVYADGRIMKYNWELSSDMDVEDLRGEALEDHIRRLLEEQNGQQG
jgi:hypothetical protein